MWYERLAWVGNIVLAGIAIWLSWWPISGQLSKWVTVGIAVLVIVAAITLFPRRRADGSTARLVDSFRTTVKGSGNVQIARDHANQIMNTTRGDDGAKRDER